ncbi:MAG: BBP7 family outer membrane beta-barrel protein [Thermoguttaceae bacterium]|nr:BBP7 family outer membrane beta-barrel protein [Thermoguttaceae bacterium]
MASAAHRLLLGMAFCCLVLGTTAKLGAQSLAYNTIQPAPKVLKEAVYPFFLPLSYFVQMTRWDWEGGPGVCGPGGCGDPACTNPECRRPCCPCGPEGQFWARADYLVWWTRGTNVPALVTTGSPTDPVPGALDQPNTEILFGERAYNGDARHQYRFQLGYWLGHCRRWAIQGDWLDLGQSSSGFSDASAGNPLLGRPFFDVLRDIEAVQMIAFPGFAEGQVDASVSSGFHSAGASFRRNLICGFADAGTPDGGTTLAAGDVPCGRMDLMAGYRHYALYDAVTVHAHSTLLQGVNGYVAGTQFDIRDSFRSRNEFHGAELGLITQRYHGRWSFEFLAKLAMGSNHQTVAIDGQTVVTVPGQAPSPQGGGLLALDNTNIGTYRRNDFALIPQFNFEIGYQLTTRSRVYVGYDLLLWWHVKRAGNHIDPRVNTSYMPPPAPVGDPLPEFAWRSTDFWAQGFNLGWELRF